MTKVMLNTLLLFVFLSQPAYSQQENKKIKFVDTAKIKLLIFGKEYNGAIFKAHDPMQTHITVVSNINNIEYIELIDQFADTYSCRCIGIGTKCPKLIAKFNFNKKSTINKLSFRMRFPCKGYVSKQISISLMVNLKTFDGKYFRRKYTIPITTGHHW